MHVNSSIAPNIPNRGVALAPTNYTATNVSSELAGLNPRRVAITIQNLGGKEVSLAFGSHSAVYESGITLDKNGGSLVLDSTICITGTIQIIAKSGTSIISIQEFE